jgi:DNA repair exonuclease SbcCD ATPase subunit/DNA repair exonuclease SbcCD nuclease subunit
MKKSKKLKKKEVVITGDFHIGNTSDSVVVEFKDLDCEIVHIPSKVAETFKQVDRVITCAAIKKYRLKIFGDIFHTNRPIPLYEQMFIKRLNYLEKHGVDTHIFKGNHEENTANKDALAPFQSIKYEHIKFFSDICNVVEDNINWIYIPHINKARFGEDATDEMVTDFITKKVLKLIDKKKRNIIGGHFHSEGAMTGSEEFMLRGGINFYNGKKVRNYVDWMFLQHIHKHQEFKCNGIKTVYGGSLTKTDFGEEQEDKGFVIYDPSKNNYRFIKNDTTQYRTIKIDFVTKDTISLDSRKIEKMCKDKIIKLRYSISDTNRHKVNFQEIEKAFSEHCYVARTERCIVNKKGERREHSAERSPNKLIKDYMKSLLELKKEEREEATRKAIDTFNSIAKDAPQIISSMGEIVLESIDLENFRCFENITLDGLEDKSVIGVIGEYNKSKARSNGSGKTTLLMAILWIIYGTYKRGDLSISDKRLIRRKAKSASGTLILNNNGVRIKITRNISKKKSADLELSVDGVNKSSKNHETQDLINELMGMDYELFTAIAFFAERGNDTICSATPGKRKEYLRSILKLDRWEDAGKIAKKEYDTESRELDDMELLIREAEDVLDSINIKSITSKKNVLDSKIEEKKSDLKVLQDKVVKMLALKQSRKDLRRRLDEASDEMDELKSELKDGEDDLKKNKKELKTALESGTQKAIESKVAKKEKAIESLKKKSSEERFGGESVKKQISELGEEDKCIHCRQDINKKYKGILLKALEGELSNYRASYEKITKATKRAVNELNDLNEILSSITESQETVDENIRYIERRKEKIEKKKPILAKLDKEYSQANTVNESTLRKTQTKIEEGESEVDDLNEELGRYNQQIKDHKKHEKGIKNKKKEYKDQVHKVTICKIVSDCFGPNGVSARIISNTLEEIEDYANDILKEIDNGEKRIEFRTNKEVGKGRKKAIRDTLDIWIYDSNGDEGKYEEYSNGESVTINFSIRLALSKVLSKSQNSWSGIVVLDELFGSLDEYNKEKMVNVINHLKKEFSQVFIISHTDIKDAFDNTVYIRKNLETNISSIKKVA